MNKVINLSRQNIELISISMVAVLVFYWIQFSGPFLSGVDPYYHVGVSKLYAERGLLRGFPWTQCSIHRQGFGDKDFLFHIAMIPFLHKNPTQGGKAYAAFLATACVLVFALILRSFHVPHVWFWVVLLFSSGPYFLYRFSVVRPQIVSVLFALLSFWAVCKQRTAALFLVSILSFLFYASAHPPLLIALIYTGVAFHETHRLLWRPVLSALAGLVIGMLIHPHFPTIFTVWTVQVFHVFYHSLARTPGLNLGAELGSPSAGDLVTSLSAVLLVCTAILYAGLSKEKRTSLAARTGFLTLCVFLFMTCLSNRFIEYSAPFFCLFAALAYADLKTTSPSESGAHLNIAKALLALTTIGVSVKAAYDTHEVIALTGAPKLKPAATWLARNSAEGDVVFTCDWDDFPQLFFYNTHNYYIAAFDPTYFFAHDKTRFQIWNRIRTGVQRNIGQEIARRFHARYFLATSDYAAAIQNARSDSSLVQVYADQNAHIYEVAQPKEGG